jgi:DNA end-binding protein Ku
VVRRSFPGTLRVLVPTVVAGFVASRAAPWVVSRVRPLVDAGRSQVQRAAGRKRGGSRERSLEELTKEELYERAQAADIEGRSTMSKDELVRALKARG